MAKDESQEYLRRIRKLLQIMDKASLAELEWEENNFRVKLRRYENGTRAAVPPAPETLPRPEAAPAVKRTEEEAAGVRAQEIKSPIVGTFYRSAKPDAAPLVDVGAQVTPETVVCIVEAMKVLNEIKAGVSGRVKRVLVENAHAVEYGQVLMEVE
jgi:acetyl-CoA carboxylase biotin carboxyl carrier protein